MHASVFVRLKVGCFTLLGGRYDQQSDGLHISNVTSSDEGAYYCQAVVESSGMFKEQTVTLKLLGTRQSSDSIASLTYVVTSRQAAKMYSRCLD